MTKIQESSHIALSCICFSGNILRFAPFFFFLDMLTTIIEFAYLFRITEDTTKQIVFFTLLATCMYEYLLPKINSVLCQYH